MLVYNIPHAHPHQITNERVYCPNFAKFCVAVRLNAQEEVWWGGRRDGWDQGNEWKDEDVTGRVVWLGRKKVGLFPVYIRNA